MEMIFIYGVFSLILSISFVFTIYNVNIFELDLYDLLINTLVIFCIFFATSFTSNFLTIPIIFIYGIIYFYCKYKKLLQALFFIIISLLILIFSDIISGLIITCILNYKYINLNKDNLPSWSLYSLMFLLSYLLSKSVGYVIKKVYPRNINSKKNFNLSTVLIINISMAALILYLTIAINRSLMPTLSKTYIITLAILFSIYFISSFIFIYIYSKDLKDQLTSDSRENEYLQLKEYTEVIEQTLNDMRSFKHDYSNILSSINIYIENNDMEGLKRFYDTNINDISKALLNKNSNIANLKHLKISPLKGLLSSKIIKANSLKIKTSASLIEDINDIPINIIDLTRILGILFDNAIEASLLCDNPQIDFGFAKKNNSIIIFISNTCSPNTPPIHQMYKKGFSTKGENRGLGLYILKNIIDKSYKNVTINTSKEDKVFKQVLYISPKMSDIKEYQKAI